MKDYTMKASAKQSIIVSYKANNFTQDALRGKARFPNEALIEYQENANLTSQLEWSLGLQLTS